MKLHPNDITVTLEKIILTEFHRLSNPGDLFMLKHLSSNDPDQRLVITSWYGWPAGCLTLAGDYGPVEME